METPTSDSVGLRFRAVLGETARDDVVYLRGELDLGTIQVAEEFAVEILTESKRERFVLDVADLSFCGSQGLALFVRLDRISRAYGREFLIRHPEPMLTHLLALTMLDESLLVEA